MIALAALILLVALSGFFSAAETAFASLNEIRLKSRAEEGDAAAARVLALSRQRDKVFATILVGDTVANLAAASLGVLLLIRPLGALRGTLVSALILAVLILLFGEIGPRSLAREIPEKVATACAPLLQVFITLLDTLYLAVRAVVQTGGTAVPCAGRARFHHRGRADHHGIRGRERGVS